MITLICSTKILKNTVLELTETRVLKKIKNTNKKPFILFNNHCVLHRSQGRIAKKGFNDCLMASLTINGLLCVFNGTRKIFVSL